MVLFRKFIKFWIDVNFGVGRKPNLLNFIPDMLLFIGIPVELRYVGHCGFSGKGECGGDCRCYFSLSNAGLMGIRDHLRKNLSYSDSPVVLELIQRSLSWPDENSFRALIDDK